MECPRLASQGPGSVAGLVAKAAGDASALLGPEQPVPGHGRPPAVSQLAEAVLWACAAPGSPPIGSPTLAPTRRGREFRRSPITRGIACNAGGWTFLGLTAGFGRHAQDFDQPHDRPKQIGVCALDAPGAAARRLPGSFVPGGPPGELGRAPHPASDRRTTGLAQRGWRPLHPPSQSRRVLDHRPALVPERFVSLRTRTPKPPAPPIPRRRTGGATRFVNGSCARSSRRNRACSAPARSARYAASWGSSLARLCRQCLRPTAPATRSWGQGSALLIGWSVIHW